jgi:cytolysin-activating lysine-acyltransferase
MNTANATGGTAHRPSMAWSAGGTRQANANGNSNATGNVGAGAGASPLGQLGIPSTPQQQTAQEAAVAAAVEKVSLFGQVAWLLLQYPPHEHRFVSDFDWMVMPAVQLNQFRLWQNNGMPIVYASWAYLNEAAEARIKQDIKKLVPTDWKSGETLWLIDLIAPFGGADEAVADLKATVLEGKTIKSLHPGTDGQVRVMEV